MIVVPLRTLDFFLLVNLLTCKYISVTKKRDERMIYIYMSELQLFGTIQILPIFR